MVSLWQSGVIFGNPAIGAAMRSLWPESKFKSPACLNHDIRRLECYNIILFVSFYQLGKTDFQAKLRKS